MQGFILHTAKARDEDLIVTILTATALKKLYRFYGARHSIVHLGHKVDFEEQIESVNFLPRLRNVTHLGFKFLYDLEKLKIWHQFLKLLNLHLQGVESIDAFYFELLDEMASRFEKQNPKRACAEYYIKLLHHEGRIHSLDRCYFCNEDLDREEIALSRAFLPSHQRCSYSKIFHHKKIENFFTKKSTLFVDDVEIDMLWDIVLEGF